MGRKVFMEKHRNSEIKTPILSNQRLLFTLIILFHCTIITNPDTFICDPSYSNSHSHSNYVNHNKNIILCPSLLSYDNDIDHHYNYYHHQYHQYQHQHQHQQQEPDKYFSSFADELHKLFHSENKILNYYTYHFEHNHRYHSYHHYNLEHLRKTSYVDYMKETQHELQNWWNTFSFYTVWMKIPNSWKMKTVAVGLADTVFIVIIKYLVFEDNYQF